MLGCGNEDRQRDGGDAVTMALRDDSRMPCSSMMVERPKLARSFWPDQAHIASGEIVSPALNIASGNQPCPRQTFQINRPPMAKATSEKPNA